MAMKIWPDITAKQAYIRQINLKCGKIIISSHRQELFPDKVKLRVRFSLDNLKRDDDVLNIPLFMADQKAGPLQAIAGHPRIHGLWPPP